MGKATISTNVGLGEYTVVIDYDTARAEVRQTNLNTDIVNLASQIATNEAELVVAESIKTVKLGELNTNIADAKAATGGGKEFTQIWQDLLNETTKALVEVNVAIQKLESLLSNYKLVKAKKQIEVDAITAALVVYQNPAPVSAWCTDYSLTLTGIVGTIELDDETNAPNDQPIIIAPAGATDTKITQPAISSGAYAIAYNLAALPAFQKYKPRYRQGKITSVDKVADTCDITFNEEYEFSSVEGYNTAKYNIFQDTALTAVPIIYNPCNSAIFEVDDQVVVGFNEDWATPKVIGFVANPRPCGLEIFFNTTSTVFGSKVMSAEIDDVTSNISFLTDGIGLSGNVDWWSGELVNDIRLSWNGPLARSFSAPIMLYSGEDRNSPTGTGRVSEILIADANPSLVVTLTYMPVSWANIVYKDSGIYAQMTLGFLITGACFSAGANGSQALLVSVYVDSAREKQKIYLQAFKNGPFNLLYTHTYDSTLYYVFPRMSPSFFNMAGDKVLFHNSRILKSMVASEIQSSGGDGITLANTKSSEDSKDMVEVEITELNINLSAIDFATFDISDITGLEVTLVNTSASSLYNPAVVNFTELTNGTINFTPTERISATTGGATFKMFSDWRVSGISDIRSDFTITLPAETEVNQEVASGGPIIRTVSRAINSIKSVTFTTGGAYNNTVVFVNNFYTRNFNENLTPANPNPRSFTSSKAFVSILVDIAYADLRRDMVVTLEDKTTVNVSGTGQTSWDLIDGETYVESFTGSVDKDSKIKVFTDGVSEEIVAFTNSETPNFDSSGDFATKPIEVFNTGVNDEILPYDGLDTDFFTSPFSKHHFAYIGPYSGSNTWARVDVTIPGGRYSMNWEAHNPTSNLRFAGNVTPVYMFQSLVGSISHNMDNSFVGATITKDGNLFVTILEANVSKSQIPIIAYTNGSTLMQNNGIAILEAKIGSGVVTIASNPKNIT